MTRQELLNYVRKNPQDKEAFYEYMDMLAIAPGRIEVSIEELEDILKKNN